MTKLQIFFRKKVNLKLTLNAAIQWPKILLFSGTMLIRMFAAQKLALLKNHLMTAELKNDNLKKLEIFGAISIVKSVNKNIFDKINFCFHSFYTFEQSMLALFEKF